MTINKSKAVGPLTESVFPLLRRIIASNWQTSDGWLRSAPYHQTPPDEFVFQVLLTCKFREVHMDTDQIPEWVMELSYAPGTTGNTSFYLLKQEGQTWRLWGEFGGNALQVGALIGEFRQISTTWRSSLDSYTTTVYREVDGEYRKHSQIEWSPRPNGE